MNPLSKREKARKLIYDLYKGYLYCRYLEDNDPDELNSPGFDKFLQRAEEKIKELNQLGLPEAGEFFLVGRSVKPEFLDSYLDYYLDN